MLTKMATLVVCGVLAGCVGQLSGEAEAGDDTEGGSAQCFLFSPGGAAAGVCKPLTGAIPGTYMCCAEDNPEHCLDWCEENAQIPAMVFGDQ
jgi:hypothetical protein